MKLMAIALLGTAPGMAFLAAGRAPVKAAPVTPAARVEHAPAKVAAPEAQAAKGVELEEDCGGD